MVNMVNNTIKLKRTQENNKRTSFSNLLKKTAEDEISLSGQQNYKSGYPIITIT